ncbi:MAG: ribosome-binding factor A [Rickettsiales bacterium]|jgi:ribosome-binding factor A|nr:ribosome-binding factor A [Rickettsiales bacterium]
MSTTDYKTNGNSTENFRLRRSSDLRRTLGDILSKGEFSSGGKQIFIDVIEVAVSKDLKSAKVLVSIFGLEPEDQRKFLDRLNGAFARQVRGIVANKIREKFVPKFSFHVADSNEKKEKVLALIEKQKNDYGGQ